MSFGDISVRSSQGTIRSGQGTYNGNPNQQQNLGTNTLFTHLSDQLISYEVAKSMHSNIFSLILWSYIYRSSVRQFEVKLSSWNAENLDLLRKMSNILFCKFCAPFYNLIFVQNTSIEIQFRDLRQIESRLKNQVLNYTKLEYHVYLNIICFYIDWFSDTANR